MRINYSPQLDGLRAMAALAVMIHHYAPREFFNYWHFPLAAYGVHLFFVLSGYLISSSLMHDQKELLGQGYGWKNVLAVFYIKRALRIFPLFYFALFVLFVFDIGTSRDVVGWNAAYLTNFHIAYTGMADRFSGHLWTLSVEEQFYLIYPLLFLLLAKRNIILVLLIGLISLAAIKWAGVTLGAIKPVYLPTHVGDSLVMGCLLAWSRAYNHDALYARMMGVVGACLLLESWSSQMYGRPSLTPFGLTTTWIGMISVWLVYRVSKGISNPVGNFLSVKPMVFLGKISYGIYVWHIIALGLTAKLYLYIGDVSLKPILLSQYFRALVTLALAVFTWYAFEKRLLKLKRPLVEKYLKTREAVGVGNK